MESSSSSSSSTTTSKRPIPNVMRAAKSAAAQRSNKRMRHLAPTDFHITLSPTRAFQTIVNAAEKLTTESEWRIIKSTGESKFEGVRVDCSGPGFMWMFKSMLECYVNIDDPNISEVGFAVTSKNLNNAMKYVTGDSIEIVRFKGRAM